MQSRDGRTFFVMSHLRINGAYNTELNTFSNLARDKKKKKRFPGDCRIWKSVKLREGHIFWSSNQTLSFFKSQIPNSSCPNLRSLYFPFTFFRCVQYRFFLIPLHLPTHLSTSLVLIKISLVPAAEIPTASLYRLTSYRNLSAFTETEAVDTGNKKRKKY